MKKIYGALLAALALSASGTASAMDQETLLADPARYRVIYADEREAVYADMDTALAMSSRDYPGSIENISFTMYVESFAKKPDAMAFQKEETVDCIQEYEATLYGNKAKDEYDLEKKLSAVYSRDGEKLDEGAWKGAKSRAEADDMYYSLFRAVRASSANEGTFLADPERYRVIAAGEDEVIYADMTTVMGMQTMDYPGSIENVHFTMYAESYRDKVDAWDFAKDRLVTDVRTFDAAIHADKRKQKYSAELKLTDVRGAADNEAADQERKEDGRIRADAKDLYMNLYRLERLPKETPAAEAEEK